MNDEPREPKRAPLETAEVIKKRIAEEIGRRMPLGWRFCLVLTSDAHTSFVSNATEDPDIAAMLRSLADAIERGEAGI